MITSHNLQSSTMLRGEVVRPGPSSLLMKPPPNIHHPKQRSSQQHSKQPQQPQSQPQQPQQPQQSKQAQSQPQYPQSPDLRSTHGALSSSLSSLATTHHLTYPHQSISPSPSQYINPIHISPQIPTKIYSSQPHSTPRQISQTQLDLSASISYSTPIQPSPITTQKFSQQPLNLYSPRKLSLQATSPTLLRPIATPTVHAIQPIQQIQATSVQPFIPTQGDSGPCTPVRSVISPSLDQPIRSYSTPQLASTPIVSDPRIAPISSDSSIRSLSNQTPTKEPLQPYSSRFNYSEYTTSIPILASSSYTKPVAVQKTPRKDEADSESQTRLSSSFDLARTQSPETPESMETRRRLQELRSRTGLSEPVKLDRKNRIDELLKQSQEFRSKTVERINTSLGGAADIKAFMSKTRAEKSEMNGSLVGETQPDINLQIATSSSISTDFDGEEALLDD
eukprot:TRINITY_DN1924_c0_g2_i1.p1 TRINITY_DN1924_c0_g2~~TRINITY_DN1924_c0_g2_i1.p1  ORF type:complete len:450 (+),score=93.83 TRINITY_DN1924_c0_g2_i1:61-1410(+)